MEKPTKKEIYQYMLNKFTGQHGGLKPKNLTWQLEEGYEFTYKSLFGGTKMGITITKKQQ